MLSRRYTVTVQGRLGTRFTDAFPGASIEPGPGRQASFQRVALHELEDEEANPVGLLQTVDAGHVWMVERGHEPRLALEPFEPLRVLGCVVGKEFNGHITPETGVAGAIDFPHPAGAEPADDLVSA